MGVDVATAAGNVPPELIRAATSRGQVDAGVVWVRRAAGWVLAWPEPVAVPAISLDWAAATPKTRLAVVRWSRVPADIVLPPGASPAEGDLVVQYEVAIWHNANAVGTTPIDPAQDLDTNPHAAASSWHRGNPVAKSVNTITDDQWVVTPNIDLDDVTPFAIEVTAHYRRWDGTALVESADAPVTRVAYFAGRSPRQPLAAPTVHVEFLVDAQGLPAIPPGAGPVKVAADNGHFRGDATTGAQAGVLPRQPVPPTIRYRFDAYQGAAAAELDVPTRDVTYTVAGQPVPGSPGRPAVPATTQTVYDFPAVDGQPALTGVSAATRSYPLLDPRQSPALTFNADGTVVDAGGTAWGGFAIGANEALAGVRWNIRVVDRAGNTVGGKGGDGFIDPVDRTIETSTGLVLDRPKGKAADPLNGPATWTVGLEGAAWADQSMRYRVTGTVTADVWVNRTQAGTARTVTLPWDGVPGHAGDPGAAPSATVQPGQQITETQVGDPFDVPWDGVPGSPGDPGVKAAAAGPPKIGTWSWPFDVTVDAVVGAGAYEVRVGGGPWTRITVPAGMLGPTATGSVTLTDQWLPVQPGGGITVQSRAVKVTGGVPDPGMVGTATGVVPPYPELGPVTNLRQTRAGYRFAAASWGPPVLLAGQDRYFAGRYQIADARTAARAWEDVYGTSHYVDFGDLDVHQPNYEDPVPTPAAPTPYGINRAATGLPPDPGTPGLDTSRSFTIAVRPMAAWGVASAETAVIGTLPRKIIRWRRVEVSAQQLDRGAVWNDPNVRTWPNPAYQVVFGSMPRYDRNWADAESLYWNFWASSSHFGPGRQYPGPVLWGPGLEGVSLDLADPPSMVRQRVWNANVQPNGIVNGEHLFREFDGSAADVVSHPDWWPKGIPGSSIRADFVGGDPGDRVVGIWGSTMFTLGPSPDNAYNGRLIGPTGDVWNQDFFLGPGGTPFGGGVAGMWPVVHLDPGNGAQPGRQAAWEAGTDGRTLILRATKRNGFDVVRIFWHILVQPAPVDVPGAEHGNPSTFHPPVVTYRADTNQP